jgi:integrase
MSISTREQLKSTGHPCLFRHEANKNYYGKKKHRGKTITKALQTEQGGKITDRKLAEAALRIWLDSLDAPVKLQAITFRELYALFLQAKRGKEKSTLKTYTFRFGTIEKEAPQVLDMPVDKIKPSDFAPMLGKLEKEWKPRTFNALTLFIKQLFDLAIRDEIIEKNPYNRLTTKRLKLNDAPAQVPTVEQCERIVTSMRTQEFADTAEVSADLCAFLHLAGLGEAEADFLTWGNIDFEAGVMKCKRIKTGAYFDVPIYPHMKAFLLNMYARQGEPGPEVKAFKVRSIKKGLFNACRRLGFHPYSPRDLRKARIVWLLRQGITPETLSRWQGHKDNGVLIRRTYSWVIDDAYKQYEKAQLALLN